MLEILQKLYKIFRYVEFFIAVIIFSPTIMFFILYTRIQDKRLMNNQEYFQQAVHNNDLPTKIDFNQVDVDTLDRDNLGSVPFVVDVNGKQLNKDLYFVLPFISGLTDSNDLNYRPYSIPMSLNYSVYKSWDSIILDSRLNKITRDNLGISTEYYPEYGSNQDPFNNVTLSKIHLNSKWDWGNGHDYIQGVSSSYWDTYIRLARTIVMMRYQVARVKTGLPMKEISWYKTQTGEFYKDKGSLNKILFNPVYGYRDIGDTYGYGVANKFMYNYEHTFISGMPKIDTSIFWLYKYPDSYNNKNQYMDDHFKENTGDNGPYMTWMSLRSEDDEVARTPEDNAILDVLLNSEPTKNRVCEKTIKDLSLVSTRNFWTHKLEAEGIKVDTRYQAVISNVLGWVDHSIYVDKEKSKIWLPEVAGRYENME